MGDAMTRAYHGESADEFYGITCPEDVRSPGNEVPAHWLKHEEGCACLYCLTELKADRIEDGDE